MVAFLHTTIKPYYHCMPTWKPPRPHSPSPWIPYSLPSVPQNWIHILPRINSQINLLLHSSRTPPPPKTILLQFPGSHYTTKHLPWIPPVLNSQGNIVMTVNGPYTFHIPALNTAYLLYRPRSISTTSSTDIFPKLLQPTSQSAPLPKDPSGHLNKRNNTLIIRDHPSDSQILRYLTPTLIPL